MGRFGNLAQPEDVEKFGITYGLMTTETYMTIGNATASIYTPKTCRIELDDDSIVVYFTKATLNKGPWRPTL